VGKLVASFVFFLAASALAIHESKPPPPHDVAPPLPRPVEAAPPSRAIHDEVPPWVKYAAPATPPRAPVIVEPPLRRVITIEDSEITVSNGDIPDAVDKCPDQPSNDEDNDGCPEPEGLKDRIILID